MKLSRFRKEARKVLTNRRRRGADNPRARRNGDWDTPYDPTARWKAKRGEKGTWIVSGEEKKGDGLSHYKVKAKTGREAIKKVLSEPRLTDRPNPRARRNTHLTVGERVKWSHQGLGKIRWGEQFATEERGTVVEVYSGSEGYLVAWDHIDGLFSPVEEKDVVAASAPDQWLTTEMIEAAKRKRNIEKGITPKKNPSIDRRDRKWRLENKLGFQHVASRKWPHQHRLMLSVPPGPDQQKDLARAEEIRRAFDTSGIDEAFAHAMTKVGKAVQAFKKSQAQRTEEVMREYRKGVGSAAETVAEYKRKRNIKKSRSLGFLKDNPNLAVGTQVKLSPKALANLWGHHTEWAEEDELPLGFAKQALQVSKELRGTIEAAFPTGYIIAWKIPSGQEAAAGLHRFGLGKYQRTWGGGLQELVHEGLDVGFEYEEDKAMSEDEWAKLTPNLRKAMSEQRCGSRRLSPRTCWGTGIPKVLRKPVTPWMVVGVDPMRKNPKARRNHHLIVGEKVKYSDQGIKASIKRRPSLAIRSTWTGVVLKVLEDIGPGLPRWGKDRSKAHPGYLIRWEGRSPGDPDGGRYAQGTILTDDDWVVAADSTTTKWPGNHYEGVDPMARKNGRARRNMAFPQTLNHPVLGPIVVENMDELKEVMKVAGTGAAAPAAAPVSHGLDFGFDVGSAKGAPGTAKQLMEELTWSERAQGTYRTAMDLVGTRKAMCPGQAGKRNVTDQAILIRAGLTEENAQAFIDEMHSLFPDALQETVSKSGRTTYLKSNYKYLKDHPDVTEKGRELLSDKYGVVKGCRAKKNPLAPSPTIGFPSYYQQPTNAGPYTPQTFPYGYGGRPATYELAPQAPSLKGGSQGPSVVVSRANPSHRRIVTGGMSKEDSAELLAMLKKGTAMSCPKCPARGYEPCVTPSGARTKTHAARVEKTRKYAEHLGVKLRKNPHTRAMRYMIREAPEFPGFAPTPVGSNWTSYPTYAYEQFSRSNPITTVPLPANPFHSPVEHLASVIQKRMTTEKEDFDTAWDMALIPCDELKDWENLQPPMDTSTDAGLTEALAAYDRLREVVKKEIQEQRKPEWMVRRRPPWTQPNPVPVALIVTQLVASFIPIMQRAGANKIEKYKSLDLKGQIKMLKRWSWTIPPVRAAMENRKVATAVARKIDAILKDPEAMAQLQEVGAAGLGAAKAGYGARKGAPKKLKTRPKKQRGAPRMRMNRGGLKAVPSHIPSSPRSAAEGLYALGKGPKWPIGDLFHARLALIYAMAPANFGVHKRVLAAVERAYPQYNWAAWWDKHMEKLKRRGRKDTTLASRIELAAANPRKLSRLILS